MGSVSTELSVSVYKNRNRSYYRLYIDADLGRKLGLETGDRLQVSIKKILRKKKKSLQSKLFR